MAVIVVTGCAGFIGSHTAEKLLNSGNTVIGIDEVNDYYSVEQKNRNLAILQKFDDFVFYKEDITNHSALKEIFSRHKPEIIINLAARAGVRASIDNPFIYQKTNVQGTLTLLELCREFNLKQFIHASSSSVYGRRNKVPFMEEDITNKPVSPYAATKIATEALCHTYNHLYGLNTVCLRFFTVYGPRGRPDMAPFLFTKAISEGKPIKKFGDGTSKRDYTFIHDIVDGITACIGKDFGFEIINLGNSNPVELNEFISIIENAVGKKASIVNFDIPKADVEMTYADISKAKRLLGYDPKTSLDEGIRSFVDWFMKEGKDF